MEKQDMGSNPFSAIYLLCNFHSPCFLFPSFSDKLTFTQGFSTLVPLLLQPHWYPYFQGIN